jgi:hypothetical protein
MDELNSDLIVVVDPEYGDRLASCVRQAPVWVVASPVNTPACERLRRIHQTIDHREIGAITACSVSDVDCRVENLIGMLSTLELHHGEFRDEVLSFPKGFVLGVIGIPPGDRVTTALQEFGFSTFTPTQSGFRACKEPSAGTPSSI